MSHNQHQHLGQIGRAIDTLLDSKTAWTRKEFDFYKMLIQKVEKYQSKHKSYILSNEDRDDIMANFKEQPWLIKSKHKSVVINMIKTMDILHYEYAATKSETRLSVKFGFERFNICVKYCRNTSYLKYFVYYTSKDGKTKGYVCYLDSSGDLNKQNQMELPQYQQIQSIVNSRQGQLDKYDIVHVASELMLYYDQNKEISQANMGIKYPVSLAYLATIT